MPLATATPGARPQRPLSSRAVGWGGGVSSRTEWSVLGGMAVPVLERNLGKQILCKESAKGTFPRWKSSRQKVTDGKHLRPGTLCELNWVPSKQRVVVLTLRTSERDLVCKQVLGRREEVRHCHAGLGGPSSKYPGPVKTEVWGDASTS